ncbi:MAG: GMC family oxidoreductase [Parvibaculaceae bacterium]
MLRADVGPLAMPASAPPSYCDLIIVGAGSAGCVLANRLSADERLKVVLLEAGPADTSPWIHLPIGYGKTMWSADVNWRFYTDPEPTMDGRRIYWPRGRCLGGSSSINGLIAIRGQPQDYDRWVSEGASGWGWGDVLPYFNRLEDNPDFAGDPLHGQGGPVRISSIRPGNELIDAVIAGARSLGLPGNKDFNGLSQEGAGYYQLTTRNGLRASASKAYLRIARRRGNLSVVTNAQVARVLFEGGRASGVEYRQEGGLRRVEARAGVVLAAGAVQSPQLLMLSGIGEAAHLSARGIGVLRDVPEVGLNLQDHLQLRAIYRCTRPITTNDTLNSLVGRARLGLEWLFTRSGALAVGINQGAIFARILKQAETPDGQYHVATLSADMAGGKVHSFSGFTLSVCQLRPESKGRIRLASPDPFAAPSITANYLATELDRRFAVEALRFTRRLVESAPLRPYVAEEMLPGEAAGTDDDLLAFVRQNGATIFHPSCTCRMGTDERAVVDPRLRLKGLERLWVADCSVMPSLVSGNTNLPAMMIGEKASDMILEDLR